MRIGHGFAGQDDGQANKLYLLTDALGSVRGQMRGTTLQASTSYGPYGSIHQQTGNSQTSYGYTGEQFHAGTGLLYLRARYYSPSLHAFTSRDPWAGDFLKPSSLHGYMYSYNNPVMWVDLNGRCAGRSDDPTSDGVGGLCWSYLEYGFCIRVDCGDSGNWTQWLKHQDNGNWLSGYSLSFARPWKVYELVNLAKYIDHVLNALDGIHINWQNTSLKDVQVQAVIGGNAANPSYIQTVYGNHRNTSVVPVTFDPSTFTDVDGRIVYHEMGHVLQSPLGWFSEPAFVEFDILTGGTDVAADGYCFRRYGHDAYGTTNPILRQGETWADAFSVFVYLPNHGWQVPPWGDRPVGDREIYQPKWADMYVAVMEVLTKLYK